MAGFEVIVRPVVFPNIRPLPSRSLPPEDKPEQGQAVLSGSNGQVIALTHTYSGNASTTGGREIERTFDTARIKSSVDSDTHIDVEVVKKIKMNDGSNWHYTPIEPSENVEIINRDQTRSSS
jgi:hypothetical protein